MYATRWKNNEARKNFHVRVMEEEKRIPVEKTILISKKNNDCCFKFNDILDRHNSLFIHSHILVIVCTAFNILAV